MRGCPAVQDIEDSFPRINTYKGGTRKDLCFIENNELNIFKTNLLLANSARNSYRIM